tara:strand:+ start:3650 stop:3847 length:198 start_codon:yes stop_codon:yes gene_type:complete
MSQFKFSSEAFMLGQISCEMIALAQELNLNHGEKLNGELKSLDKIVQRINRVKKLIHKKDEPIRI